MKHFRRAQQRLGRNASPLVADAAEIGLLDHRGLEAELRRADRRDVAAGAGADDDDVEGGVGTVVMLYANLSLLRRIAIRYKMKPQQSPISSMAISNTRYPQLADPSASRSN